MSLEYDSTSNALPPPLPASQYSLFGQLLFKRSSATRRMRCALAVDGTPGHNLPALRYKYLEQPGEQIRLLSRHHLGGWALTNFVAANAPGYAALSYAWGSPDLIRTIIVNQCVLKVTESCWYALLQLDRMRDFKYFWIDAICINQTDLVEKGPHVRVMGDIFARAAFTFVSLGQCEEGISLVANAARQQEDCTSTDSRSLMKGVRSADWSVRSLDTEGYEMLIAAMQELQEKPWWRRLWVLQEALKSNQVSFMCGASTFAWKDLRDILNELVECYFPDPVLGPGIAEGLCLHSHTDISALKDLVLSHMDTLLRCDQTYKLMDFATLLEITESKICSDPRDIIYGILSLVQRQDNVPPMSVDYSISTWSVAKNAFDHYSVGKNLFDTLEIVEELTSQLRLEESIEFQQLQYQRHALYTKNDFHLEEAPEKFDRTLTRTWTTPRRKEQAFLSPLMEQLDGQLSVDLIEIPGLDPKASLSKSDVVNIGAWPVVLRGRVVGYASGSVQPGDLLLDLRLEWFQTYPLLRRSSDRVYRIVGMAVLMVGLKFRQNDLDPLKLYFDTEDLFFLACTSRLHSRNWSAGRKSMSSLDFCPTRSAFSSFAVAMPM